ncbi:MAG: hypothetical protein HC884_08570 [Chloroflexaceae bacterium]|nr:hypothetical protein [Chloroflexaceae bacterium]
MPPSVLLRVAPDGPGLAMYGFISRPHLVSHQVGRHFARLLLRQRS